MILQKRYFSSVYLAFGLAVQVAVYLWQPDNPWTLVSGLFGICSVILCSEGNIFTFFFGFGQILTYTYLCYLERFYAEIGMNMFYFASQLFGIYTWRKRIGKNTGVEHELPARRLTGRMLLLITTLSLVVSAIVGVCLAKYTDDSQPYLDAFTTVPSITAQILMVMAYREQWIYWLVIDMAYVVLWLNADNGWCMVMQYAFWCINCIYGYYRWTRSSEMKIV